MVYWIVVGDELQVACVVIDVVSMVVLDGLTGIGSAVRVVACFVEVVVAVGAAAGTCVFILVPGYLITSVFARVHNAFRESM